MQKHAPEAVDISRETAETQRLYGVDRAETSEFGRRCLLARLDGAHQTRLQRRLVLLEIQRHLLIGDAPPERPHEKIENRSDDRRGQQDPRGNDRGGGKPRPLHPICGHHEEHDGHADAPRDASQRQLRAPARAHLVDDLGEIRSGGGSSPQVVCVLEHEALSRMTPGPRGLSMLGPRGSAYVRGCTADAPPLRIRPSLGGRLGFRQPIGD